MSENGASVKAACVVSAIVLLTAGLSVSNGPIPDRAESDVTPNHFDESQRRIRGAHNYEFRIDEWLPKSPLTLFVPDPPYSAHTHYNGEIVTSPAHVCDNEHLRRGMRDVYRWGRGVPMDVFVMADGEPPDRHVTKIGGLPYRPADKPWPVDAAGKPLLFIAQFNFADSTDLVGDLPAELLLVFADSQNAFAERVHFEWQSLTTDQLVSSAGVPEHPDQFTPCFGYRYRTMNFPDAERDEVENHPQYNGKDVWGDHHVPVYQATQIGRAPFWIQGVDELPGQIICTISSVQPAADKPYPWVNHPAPIDLNTAILRDNHLMLADMGCIYISFDEEGQLHWSGQSY